MTLDSASVVNDPSRTQDAHWWAIMMSYRSLIVRVVILIVDLSTISVVLFILIASYFLLEKF